MTDEHIKTLLDAGWSQLRIATASGIKQSCINRIIKGRQKDVHYAQGKRLELLASLVKSNAGISVIETA